MLGVANMHISSTYVLNDVQKNIACAEFNMQDNSVVCRRTRLDERCQVRRVIVVHEMVVAGVVRGVE